MKLLRKSFLIFITNLFVFITLNAQSLNKAVYKPRYHDPVLEQMKEQREKDISRDDSLTAAIRTQQEARRKIDKKDELSLQSDLSGVKKPASLNVFKTIDHFPPIAQYQSGMCWCFCGTSFLESEVMRLTGQKIKISELHTIYYEYLEKAARFIRERGDSFIGEGGEVNGVFRIMKKYGAVPAEVYTGLPHGDKHDHTRLFTEIRNYLEYCKTNNYWDEEIALNSIKLILNKYLGEPPQSFIYEGQEYTPVTFLNNVLKLQLDDYCDVMSTTAVPFYIRAEFKVEDNWWHDSSYINIPLAEWYKFLKKAITGGYSLAIGGDVSEPGYLGFEDVAFIPDFDIPFKYINQDSREFRIYNKTTTDDHGLHLVGYTRIDDRYWFLVKDSARSSRWGKYEGYYFYREDYIRLKMLTYTVHKDVLKEILNQIK
ncbi:MAG TPA: C1 family peptidase [Candidatus Marinimicrobia bacterium]|nr:C1 family peptidase [Candidatus Neomarinimicrobiota bacterium]